MAHVSGQSRHQATLFPETLEDFVGGDHPVRVIDAFVDGLDLALLGFGKVVAEETGRPPYHPGDLVKLYVYGYLNQVRSSRRLEREARRNVEVMWLTRRIRPAFKTIADFRKDHAEAIVGVCRAFVGFCRQQGLFGGVVLAVDGTKLWAVASRKQVLTAKKAAEMTAAIDRKIGEYLAALDAADGQEGAEVPDRVDVQAALKALEEQREQLELEAKALKESGAGQKVMSEPEAKLMRTARHGHQVSYNGQIAVDGKHKLIVAFDLVNDGNDHAQLYPMAAAGKQAVGAEQVNVVADTGYSNGEHGERCASEGITAMVPRPKTVNPEGEQYFTRDQFGYDRESDSWRCPAGETLSRRKVSHSEQKYEYWSTACGGCPLKAQCTKAAKRVIVRSFFEDAREAMHQRVMADRQWMKQRRELVEHPFSGIKWLMGLPRFLVRGLKKAKAELALSILGYNLKRVISILGVPALLKILRQAPC